jgi:glycosyltransferase involved in cell wall biosynthesis
MIYVDISAAVHSRAGLGRYAERLAGALIAAQPERFGLFYNQGTRRPFPPLSPYPYPHPPRQPGLQTLAMAVLLAGQMAGAGFNRLVPGTELFHSTEHLLLPLRGVPTVLTVHDLIYKLFPEYHKKLNYWYLNLAMPLFCRRADAIIAVSQASKQDCVRQYGLDPAKIHVVYEAASSHFQPPPPTRRTMLSRHTDLPEQYLLHLSTIEPRKNLSRLLDALLALRRTLPPLSLVLVGGKGWLYDDFFAKIEAMGLQTAVLPLGWVPDEDLPAVIAAAALAVQPSLYEGFGLPILEHMACGQVVAASRAGSHPEVGGEAAAYFDPENVAEMTAVIHRLLTDKDEYAHRRQLGLPASRPI